MMRPFAQLTSTLPVKLWMTRCIRYCKFEIREEGYS